MNPELLRNLWLELTPTRRWGVPFTVATVMVMVALVEASADPMAMVKGYAAAGLGRLEGKLEGIERHGEQEALPGIGS